MPSLEQLPFRGTLSPSFFNLPTRLYQDADRPVEDAAAVEQLFRDEAARNDIITYTDHARMRLVGIFPHDSAEAYFGFWETTNELALNQAAFRRLGAEARRRGRGRLVGPLNFSTFYAYRLRLGAVPSWGRFDTEPANPPYYPALLDQLGFAPALTFESRLIRADAVPAAYQQKTALRAALRQLPFACIPLNPDTWRQYETALFALVDQIFGANPAYRGIPRAQFERLYNADFAARLCPHTSVLFRDNATGRLVALSFCQPNYVPLRLDTTPPDYARDYPRLPQKTMLAKTVGVHPDFRNQQLMNYLGAYGMGRFRELYEQAIFCLMRSDNFSRHFTDGLPAEVARYALFSRELTGSRGFFS